MPKLTARYVPIGTKIEDQETINNHKNLKELELEAQKRKLKNGPRHVNLGVKSNDKLVQTEKDNVSSNDQNHEITQYGLTPPKQEAIKPLVPIVKQEIKLPEVSSSSEIMDSDEDLFEEDFLVELEKIEIQVKHDIKTKRIKLFPTNAEQNMTNITDVFDQVVDEVSESVNYEVLNERKILYSEVLSQASTKLDKLEQSIDHQSYHNELRLVEFEDSRLRINRYRKRKFEGLEEIGGVAGKDHKTSEKNQDIAIRKNTDFNDSEKRVPEENIIRRSFVQDYEGSDLDDVDGQRDKLEQEILEKQGKPKKFRGKSEEQKIAEAKERLRKKQEKRLAKRRKREKIEDVAEIDLVGNQFDVDELREERMDRLLEIKRLSAEKKEMQKQKEKQRSKATKEFYKYKKVNKKSHIVGFKQQ